MKKKSTRYQNGAIYKEMTPLEERASIAAQMPISNVQYNVQTNEVKEGNLPPSLYTRVDYKNGTKDYLTADGYRDLQRMNNYRLYRESLVPKVQNTGIAEMQGGGDFYGNNNPYFMQNPGAQTNFNYPQVPQNIGYTPQAMGFPNSMPQIQNYSQNFAQNNPAVPYNVNNFQAPSLGDESSMYKQGDLNVDGVVDEQRNDNGKTKFYNPYGGFDIPSAAYRLGEGIKSGNAFDIVTGGLKVATGLGRNIASGIGQETRREYVLDEYNKDVRNASRPNVIRSQNGGHFQTGGQMMGQQAPENDIVSQVASALQSGADPQQLLQQLVESGVTQQEAVKLIQGVLQQLQEGQSQQQDSQEQAVMQMGGSYLEQLKGKKIKSYALNTTTNNYEVEYE